jgi:drug/metabolite transporter (DMT)-like permease
MSRRHVLMLLALAALWGSSFMFIEIALRDLAPSTLILLRMLSGAVTLAVYVVLAGHDLRSMRPYVWPLALLGAGNTAIPFFLIAWGQQYIDSGLASILNASAPLFTALFALGYDRSQRVTGLRLVGIFLGFAGVVLLVGFELSGGERAVVGGLAVVAAAAFYGIGGLYAGRRFNGLPPALVAYGALLWSSLFVAPVGIAQATTPGWEATLSVLYLGVLATGAAYLLYFGLIAGAGASKAVLVTYLVPSLALMYGAFFLDEEVTALAIAGLALVLAGVALGTGTLRGRAPTRPWRRPADSLSR